MSGVVVVSEFNEYKKAIEEKIEAISKEIEGLKENIKTLPLEAISKEIEGLKVEVEALKMTGEALPKLEPEIVSKINMAMKDLLEKLGDVLSKLSEDGINAKVFWNSNFGIFKIYFSKEQ
jgi:regulator of replication initiation timing